MTAAGAAFEQGADSAEYVAIEGAASPWSPDSCHGGAPAALLVQVAETLPAPASMSVARVTVDLLRAVPLGRLRVEARVIREGRKIQLVELGLDANGVRVAKAMVLRVRDRPEAVPNPILAPEFRISGPDQGRPTRAPQIGGFSALFTMAAVRGGFESSGPASVWFRMDAPLVAGMATSAAARAVAAADFANGIAGVLPFEHWLYPTIDLNVSLLRRPAGEWLLVDAETWIGAEGRSLCRIGLGDSSGWFGSGTQTALLEARLREGETG
jgi:acyl-coenzyme A thioesterase PaaI-like protein